MPFDHSDQKTGSDRAQSEKTICPPGYTSWLRLRLPAMGIAERPAGVPARLWSLVEHARSNASTTLRMPVKEPGLSALLTAPGVEIVERWFRSLGDPYRLCSWDAIGISCRHQPSCSE